MGLYLKQLHGTDSFVILTEGKLLGHLTRLDDKGALDRAHATLFTGAPDLLEALSCEEVDLTLLHRAIDEGDPKAELLLRVSDCLRRIRAAILKATGPAA